MTAASAGWLIRADTTKRRRRSGSIAHPSRTAGSNRVGLIAEIPDMAAFQEFMQTEAAAEAMKADGVRPETLLILDEG